VVSFRTWPVPFGSSLGLVTLIFITAIFTVSVTEGPTAPGVGAFDSEGRERSNSTRPTVPLIEVVSFRTWPVPLGFSLGLVTLIRSP